MINWVIIGIVFLFLALLYLKFEHQGRRIKLVLIIILAAILLLSLMSVFSSKNVDLSSPGGIIKAGYFYIGWVGHTISSLWEVGVETTGKVIKAVDMNNSSRSK